MCTRLYRAGHRFISHLTKLAINQSSRRNSSRKLNVPIPRIYLFKSSQVYSGPAVWPELTLPSALRLPVSPSAFKKRLILHSYLFHVTVTVKPWQYREQISLLSGLRCLQCCAASGCPKMTLLCVHVLFACVGQLSMTNIWFIMPARVSVFTPDLAALYIYNIPYCFNSHYRILFSRFSLVLFLTAPQLRLSENRMQSRREKDKQFYWFSGAITLTLTVRWKEFTNETSDRCLQELNLLCCWQLSTWYICNNLSKGSGACGWSTRGSSIWPVLFVQLVLNTWCLSQV